MRKPKVFKLQIDPGKAEEITLPRAASYTQVDNRGDTPISVLLNNDIEAVLELSPGTVQIFNRSDLDIVSIGILNESQSTARVQVIVGVDE